MISSDPVSSDPVSKKELEKLQSQIGYDFREPALLVQALTHRSHSSVNNERLEFLGDSILNFIIAQALYAQFPTGAEGQLSRLRARMVRQSTLADIGREFNLGPRLIMGSGELKTGGFDRSSILSDAVEAIIGAMLLDSDVGTTTACVLGWYASRLQTLSLEGLQKDAKSRLQELLQSRGLPVPVYEVVSMTGKSPNQEFEVACQIEGQSTSVTATGTSKRRAEQESAKLAIARLEAEL